jgi:ribulose-5-phosphate 4-epimerase/fuculose-1-phosphate aldolase
MAVMSSGPYGSEERDLAPGQAGAPGDAGEAALRRTLVEAIRMLAGAGLIDHAGHGSARRDDGSFYINSGASVRRVLTADDIVTTDLDGRLLEGTARPPLEYHIHAEIYRARPDVRAVLHTHPHWSTFLTMAGVPMQPVYPQGTLLGTPALLDSPLSVNTKEMGRRLAATLGAGRVALLKSHGAVVAGADLVECFALALYCEENAYRQYMAMQIGRPYVFSEEEQEACRKSLWSPGLFRKAWDHHRSKLG